MFLATVFVIFFVTTCTAQRSLQAKYKVFNTSHHVDCNGRENGLYVLGCNDMYTKCHNNISYPSMCEHVFYFNPHRGRCTYRDDIKQCRNHEEYYGKLIKSDVYSCEGRPDGNYSWPGVACDVQFYSCLNQDFSLWTCENELFNPTTQLCHPSRDMVMNCIESLKISHFLYAALIPDALLGESDTSRSPDMINKTAPLHGSSFPNYVERIADSNNETNLECAIVDDGLYADSVDSCSKHFHMCLNGTDFKFRCLGELAYDGEFKRCAHISFLTQCGGINALKIGAHQSAVDFDCSVKVAGYYSKNKCSSVFYSCADGVAQMLMCYRGMVFNNDSKRCSNPGECGYSTNINQTSSVITCAGQFNKRTSLNICVSHFYYIVLFCTAFVLLIMMLQKQIDSADKHSGKLECVA